jgi:hypothetical protein
VKSKLIYTSGLIWQHAELICWVTSLVYLFLPLHEGPVVCIFKVIGFSHCPGCGIGHAIHYAMHGQFAESFNAHYSGIPAVIIICHRIFQLTTQSLPKPTNNGKKSIHDDPCPGTR